MGGDVILEGRVRDLISKFDLKSGVKAQINLRRVRAYILEMEDVLFHHNSAVMMPDKPEGKSSADGSADPDTDKKQNAISGLKVLAVAFKQFEFDSNLRLVVAGHADTSGDYKYNFEISMMRAQNVLYLLEGGKGADWAKICYDRHKIEDYQQIMRYFAAIYKDWNCDPLVINDKWGDSTETATTNFFQHTGLAPDTVTKVKHDVRKRWPVDAWLAVYDLYIKEICKALGIPDEAALDSQYRNLLKFVDDTKKCVGCGESFPIDKAEKDNYKSQENRRVELFFFHKEDAPLVMDCPDRLTSRHTTDECPLCNKRHLEPVYIDPGDLTAVAYHMQFNFYDPVKKSYQFIPEGLTIGAFEIVAGVIKEVPASTTFSSGVYLVRVQDNPARSDLYFEFTTAADSWVFTENDSATAKIVTKPVAEVRALAWSKRCCYYDLPVKWSSRNYWTRKTGDAAAGKRFEDYLTANGIKPKGSKKTSTGEPLIFCLDDIVLVNAGVGQPVGSQDVKDKNATGTAMNLSANSRLTLFWLDATDEFKLKIYAGRNDALHYSNIDFSQNLIHTFPGMSRLIVFCNDFYSITDRRTNEAGIAYDKKQVLGARAAVLNDAEVHHGEQIHVNYNDNSAPYDYVQTKCGNYELHYLHQCGELKGKPLSYLIIYWNTRYRVLAENPAVDPNWRANWEKLGASDSMKRTNRPYLLEKQTGPNDIIIRPFYFFESKPDAQGGEHKCWSEVSNEPGIAWMTPKLARFYQEHYKDEPGAYGTADDNLADVDGTKYTPLTTHHEMGHATGLFDDYLYSFDEGGERYAGVPSFRQPFTAPGGPYRYDLLARMFHNRCPRMRDYWHFVNWVNDESGASLDKFLKGTKFKMTYTFSGTAGSKTIELDLSNSKYRDTCKPSYRNDNFRLGTSGRMDLLLYKTGGETAHKLIDGQVFDAILVIRLKISVDFSNTLGNWLTGRRWTHEQRQNWIEQNLFVPIGNMSRIYAAECTPANDFKNTLFQIMPFFWIPGMTYRSPEDAHFHVTIRNNNTADFSARDDDITVGNNVSSAALVHYMFGLATGHAFTKAHFAPVAQWLGGPTVANATFTMKDL
jgi:hypothetical protein